MAVIAMLRFARETEVVKFAGDLFAAVFHYYVPKPDDDDVGANPAYARGIWRRNATLVDRYSTQIARSIDDDAHGEASRLCEDDRITERMSSANRIKHDIWESGKSVTDVIDAEFLTKPIDSWLDLIVPITVRTPSIMSAEEFSTKKMSELDYNHKSTVFSAAPPIADRKQRLDDAKDSGSGNVDSVAIATSDRTGVKVLSTAADNVASSGAKSEARILRTVTEAEASIKKFTPQSSGLTGSLLRMCRDSRNPALALGMRDRAGGLFEHEMSAIPICWFESKPEYKEIVDAFGTGYTDAEMLARANTRALS